MIPSKPAFSTNLVDQEGFYGRFGYLDVAEEFLFSVRPESKVWESHKAEERGGFAWKAFAKGPI